MFGINDDVKEEGTASTAEANLMSAAINELRKYYIMLGNPDISSTTSAPTDPKSSPLHPPKEPLTVTGRTVENIMYILMDNTEAAYFTGDIVTSDRLLSFFSTGADDDGNPTYKGMNKYIQIYQENAGEYPALPAEACGGGGPEGGDGFMMTGIYPHQLPSEPVSEMAEELDLDQWTTEEDASVKVSVKNCVASQRVNVPDRGPDEAPHPAHHPTIQYMAIDGLNDVLVSDANGGPDRYFTPSLSAFVFPNHRIGPSRRGTAAVSLFSNAIPTIEMSRCTPFVKMQFVSAVPPALGNRTSQLSITRFLGMNDRDLEYDKIGYGAALPTRLAKDNFLILEEGTDDSIAKYGTSLSSAGNELFQSPQLMVNANINSTDAEGNIQFVGSAGKVLNPLVPLMTLENLSVQIAGLGPALFANKTATVQFTLHDRSRMPDIAPLIASDLFSSTYVMLEYGWKHPDGEEGSLNAFGRLLNTMRSRGAFNIVSTNFRIGDDGQVKFTMKLASRGGPEAASYPIATGHLMPVAPFKQMVTVFLAEILTDVDSSATPNDDRSTEIRQKVNASMDAAGSPASVVSRKLFLDFQKFIKPTSGEESPTEEELVEALTTLIGDPSLPPGSPGADGAIATSLDSLKSEVQNKVDALKRTSDPFKMENISGFLEGQSGIASQWVSLGKVLLTFVGAPLAGSGRFDEVQLMFYRFNSQSAKARDLPSIASFLVDINAFKLDMKDYVDAFPGMSIEGFMSFVNEKIVGTSSSANYGMADLQAELTAANTPAEGEEPSESANEDRQNAVREINSKIEGRLKTIYANGEFATPEFKLPRLKLTFETLPAFVRGEDDSFDVDPSKSILRVHIYDTQASPNTDQQFLINAATDKDFTLALGLGTSTTPEAASEESDAPPDSGSSDGVVEATVESEGVAEITGGDEPEYSVYTSKIGNSDIKRLIKASAPSLTFGLGFTGLSSVSMSSSTNGSVSNVLLLNAIKNANDASPDEPQAQTSDLEDVTVIPASATATMLGCPLVEYGQHFYIDMGTGTTADNMYYITGIEHNIRPGEFSTSLSLTFSASGTTTTFRSILAAALPGLQARVESAASS